MTKEEAIKEAVYRAVHEKDVIYVLDGYYGQNNSFWTCCKNIWQIGTSGGAKQRLKQEVCIVLEDGQILEKEQQND